MSLVSMLKRAGPNGFGYGSTAEDVTAGLDLRGRTYLLTGCNSGLGLETMRVLGLRGAHILAVARTVEKARTALAEVGATGTPLACELSEPDSVRACVAEVQQLGRPLDAIICNAGIMALPELQRQHGVELQFLTNHIGHFILVTGLLDALAPAGRVVMVSSGAHAAAPSEGIEFDNLDGARGYSSWRAYGQAKLANLLFAKQLARRFEGTTRTANAVHPGVIATNLSRHMNPAMRAAMAIAKPILLKTAAQGAATTCYIAVHPDASSISGEYFADCNPAKPSKPARDTALAQRLWTVSEQIVAGFGASAASS
jgi:NAD(P)-dependent dehydrogenase (short-subunit alcohol dehydrogenase family)